ncbi:MAG: hypothetical protein GC171_00335 [Terrimonas sp.]|nr:hypothetical protein [Terrimonas sp.]
MAKQARIILNRKSEWVNNSRAYQFLIDGNVMSRVRNGESLEFQVEPGLHQFSCKAGWCGSEVIEMDIRENEIAYLVVSSGMKYYWWVAIPLLVVFVSNLIYSLTQAPKPAYFKYLFLLAVPALLYFAYYLTIRRNEYLRLEKDGNNIFNH